MENMLSNNLVKTKHLQVQAKRNQSRNERTRAGSAPI